MLTPIIYWMSNYKAMLFQTKKQSPIVYISPKSKNLYGGVKDNNQPIVGCDAVSIYRGGRILPGMCGVVYKDMLCSIALQ